MCSLGWIRIRIRWGKGEQILSDIGENLMQRSIAPSNEQYAEDLAILDFQISSATSHTFYLPDKKGKIAIWQIYSSKTRQYSHDCHTDDSNSANQLRHGEKSWDHKDVSQY